MPIPSRGQKIFFWLLISAYSTVFAEVVSGSDPFPFFHPWGLLVVLPLYGLHSLVLMGLVFRYGKPRISTMFFSGALFGLYEAYITKILWSPTWDAMIHVGGVAPVEIAVLVLWWHPFMAYILPLLVGEQFFTTSNIFRYAFPEKVLLFIESKRGGFLLAGLAGIFTSLSSQNIFHTLGSIISSAAVLFLLTRLWRRTSAHQTFAFQDLLPNPKEWWYMLAALLVIWYGVFGLIIRPEAIPGLGPQAIIWALYLFFGWMLVRSLRRSQDWVPPELPARPPLLLRVKKLLIIYAGTAALFSFLPMDVRNVTFLLAFIVGSGFGFWMLAKSLREVTAD